jgi:hypothetical protein
MAAGAACCIVALSPLQAVASEPGQCWQSYEVEAAKVRDLHIMLMLGALRCKAVNKDITGKYEAFIAKKSGLLSSYNNVLKTRFMRVNGITEGERAYEAFNTRLGNNHSGLVQAKSYCEMTDTLLTLATGAQDRELPELAMNFSASELGVDKMCEAVAPPIVAEAAPAVVEATPAAATVVAETAAPHEAITATEAAPAAAASAKGEEPVSAAAALEAAAVALQNAAASLKAAPAAQAADKPAAAPEVKPAVLQPVTASAAPVG